MKKILHLLYAPFICLGAYAQVPFSNELIPGVGGSAIRLDCRLFGDEYSNRNDFVDVLAISGDCTVYDAITKKFAPMKGNISSVYSVIEASIGQKADSIATVYATLDKNQKDAVTGDGGGVITFKIRRSALTGEWGLASSGLAGSKKIFFRNVDFRTAGGTVNNQSFAFGGGNGNRDIPSKFLVTENIENIRSNKDLTGFSDTSNFVYPGQFTKATQAQSVIPKNTSVERFKTLGWVTEVNAETGTLIGKVHRLGRGVTALANDGNAIYLAYGGNPSILLRYQTGQVILDTKILDFPEGNATIGGDDGSYLRAYKENEDGTGDFTIPIALRVDSVSNPNYNPSDAESKEMLPKYAQIFDSLLIAKDVAIRAGATMFANIGDIKICQDQGGNSILLITEKGVDASGTNYKKDQLASHLKKLDAKDGSIDGNFLDPFGRVLALGEKNILSTLIEGGVTKDGGYFFSNPDKLEVATVDGSNKSTNLLIVKENVYSSTLGRNSSAVSSSEIINEAYFTEVGNVIQGFPVKDFLSLEITPIPFSEFHLFEESSKGSKLSSSGGILVNLSGTFLGNTKGPGGNGPNGMPFDTYLTVVNGSGGTDKSMILAVRNIYTQPSPCIPLGLVGMDSENSLNSFKSWPNPTNGILHTSEAANYTVADVTGNEVKSFTSTDLLDLTSLEKGVYFVKRSTGGVNKIILQ